MERGLHQGLEVRKIPQLRGVGVFATATFPRGSLLVRYWGQTLTRKEGNARDKEYEKVGFSTYRYRVRLVDVWVHYVPGTCSTSWSYFLQYNVCRRPWRRLTPQLQN